VVVTWNREAAVTYASGNPSTDDASRLEVVHVLLLLQAAFGVLSGGVMLLFSGGNPLAIPVALGTPLLLIVLAAGVVRRWRWARRTALVVQWLVLLAFALSFLLGLFKEVDFSINLLTLITNVLLPISILRLLRRRRGAADADVPAANPAATPVSTPAAGWHVSPEAGHGC
jgi:hypothetical protein